MQRTREVLSLKHLPSASSDEILQTVCTDLATDINADLVSVWFFNRSQTKIRCELYYDSMYQSFNKGQVIYRDNCPHYFQALIEDSCIATSDAQHQNATRELADIYLIPNGIQSTLDFILHRGRTPVGVICCECRGQPRVWSEDDKSQLRIVAELLSARFNFR